MNEQSEADQAPASAEQPTASHADRVRQAGPVQTYDAGHGVRLKAWNRSGRNGDYKQAQVEQSYKDANGEPKTFTVNIPNNAIPALIEHLQQANIKHIEPQQASGRTR